jgi:putative ATPase
MPIEIYKGSILDCDVDAIVNPANSFLRHGGGLARIIADAASKNPSDPFRPNDFEKDNLRAANTPIPTGDATVTSAGALPFKGIIHAVGPIWGGGAFYERALLKAAHQNACARAYERKWRSIAIPAISCGIFGFPVEQAAPIAVNAVGDFWTLDQPNGVGMRVTFALFEQEHVDAYLRALEARAEKALAGLV